MRRAIDPDRHELGEWVARTFGRRFETEDPEEGVRAFLETRPPSSTAT